MTIRRRWCLPLLQDELTARGYSGWHPRNREVNGATERMFLRNSFSSSQGRSHPKRSAVRHPRPGPRRKDVSVPNRPARQRSASGAEWDRRNSPALVVGVKTPWGHRDLNCYPRPEGRGNLCATSPHASQLRTLIASGFSPKIRKRTSAKTSRGFNPCQDDWS